MSIFPKRRLCINRSMILYMFCMVLTLILLIKYLRKQIINSRYITVVEDGSENRQLGNNLERKKHTLLCVDTRLSLQQAHMSFPVCIHEPTEDVYISQSLYNGILYEHDFVQILMDNFIQNPDAGLLDIGANIGVYSLAAAHLGVNVIAVEPLPENIIRLKAAAKFGKVDSRISVIQAAVSDIRGEIFAYRQKGNVGGSEMVEKIGCRENCDLTAPIESIFMDDLISIIPFKRGILKIDIEGHEEKALDKGLELLDRIDFFIILMEWRAFLQLYHAPSRQPHVEELINHLTKHGYVPHEVVSSHILNTEHWGEWPNEVLWKKMS